MEDARVAQELLKLAKSLMGGNVAETREEKEALESYKEAALEIEKEFKDFNRKYLNAVNAMMRAKVKYKTLGNPVQRKLREEMAEAKADLEAAIKKMVFGAKLVY